MSIAGRKILAGLHEALAIAKGDADAARLIQRGEDGAMHDITAEWNAENRSKTRIPHRAGSARTERHIETSHTAASPREAEEG